MRSPFLINGSRKCQTSAANDRCRSASALAAFHHHFKQVTRTSPIQYLKTTRLHKARLLMVHEGLSAATASGRVGYESASQFSREFKRFFGGTPREEAERMKSVLVPATAASPYVSVQMQ